jgi:hypothetical protein
MSGQQVVRGGVPGYEITIGAFRGESIVTFRATDQSGYQSMGSIKVNSIDDLAPVVNDRAINLSKGQRLVYHPIADGDVSDSDDNNDVRIANVPSSMTGNTITLINGNTGIVYDAINVGADAAIFVWEDPHRVQATQRLTFNVTRGNTAPLSLDRIIDGIEDAQLPATLQAVDAENDALSYIIASLPANATLYQTPDGITQGAQILAPNTAVTNPLGIVILVPNTNFNGTTSFSYVANDGQADSNESIISVNLAPVNDAPAANNSPIRINASENNVVIIENILQALGAMDVDGDPLTIGDISATAGNARLDGNNLVVDPQRNYIGGSTINIPIRDPNGGERIAQVLIDYVAYDPSVFEGNLTRNDEQTRRVVPQNGRTIASNSSSAAVVYNGNTELGSGDVKYTVRLQKPNRIRGIKSADRIGNALAIHATRDSALSWQSIYSSNTMFAKPSDYLDSRAGMEVHFPGFGNSAPIDRRTKAVGQYSAEPSPNGKSWSIKENRKTHDLEGVLKLVRVKDDPFQENQIKVIAKAPTSTTQGSELDITRQYAVRASRRLESALPDGRAFLPVVELRGEYVNNIRRDFDEE